MALGLISLPGYLWAMAPKGAAAGAATAAREARALPGLRSALRNPRSALK